MAQGDILDMFGSSTAFTITLASLANAAARQSNMVDNSASNYPSAIIYVRIKSGNVPPTNGSLYTIHLIRRDSHSSPNVSDDGAGGSDAAITIENAPAIGAIIATSTANKNFYAVLDTNVLGPLGPSWGIAIRNSSGQAISATEADHSVRYVGRYQAVTP